MSTQLAIFLNNRIDELINLPENPGLTRAQIIKSMASAAGISVDTCRQILNSRIKRPPNNRLEGFAVALNMDPSDGHLILKALADNTTDPGDISHKDFIIHYSIDGITFAGYETRQ